MERFRCGHYDGSDGDMQCSIYDVMKTRLWMLAWLNDLLVPLIKHE